MYIIIIGSNRNRQASIRRCYHCSDVASIKLTSTTFLSESEFHSFWVSVDDGVIAFGRVGDVALMEWTDDYPMKVNYVGFTMDAGVDGEFRFCDLGKLDLQSRKIECDWLFHTKSDLCWVCNG